MVGKTITQKKASVAANRGKNYRESLRLEGFDNTKVVHGSTKAEVINYYKKVAQQ